MPTGGDAHRPFAAPLVSWPGGTWPPSARSVREQADAPGRLPSLVATFRAALALLIIEILPGSGSHRCTASTHRTVVAVDVDVRRLPQDHLLLSCTRVLAPALGQWPGRLHWPRLLQLLAAARWASAMLSLARYQAPAPTLISFGGRQ
jgi:hypothetical protein